MKKQFARTGTWLNLAGNVALCILVSIFLVTGVRAQLAQSDLQDQAARAFMTALFEKDFSRAWSLLDPEAHKNTTLESLQVAAKALDAVTTQFGKEVIPFMKGFRTYQNGQTVIVYTYKFKSDVSKTIASVLLDVGFKDAHTTAILGFLPKFSAQPISDSAQISTSAGTEVSLEKEQEWVISGKTIKVNELALVLDNTQALFAIKVLDDDAKTLTQPQAREKAIPIIKYAIAHGYLPKAELGASQAKRKLMEGIGVAFIQPGTRGGYRVIVAPADYKN